VSSDVFNKLNQIIWCMLYAWAKRRHHNKGKNWIVQNIGMRLGIANGYLQQAN
jgi:RNA-directed DNA polymerase